MLEFCLSGIHFKIQIWFPTLCLYMLYADPSGVVLTAVLAAMLHELGHLGAMIVCGHSPAAVIVSAFGVRFETNAEYTLGFTAEVFVALCGPFMNVLMAIALVRVSVTAAIIHAWLGATNLLPLFPLDGERILSALLRMCLAEEKADHCGLVLFWCVWPLLFCASLLLFAVGDGNISFLIFSAYIGVANLTRRAL